MSVTIPRSLPAFSALLLASAPASANVLVVALSGAPYTSIQSAIDAAAEGDTILVRTGAYPGFTLSAKSLAIVADPEAGATITGAIFVRDLTAGQHASLSGLVYHAQIGGGLSASQNAGALRLEALRSQPSLTSTTLAHGLVLSACTDVAILRCALDGSPSTAPFPSNPGMGLRVVDSRVAVYDSAIGGGQGSAAMYVGTGGSSHPALPGARGCSVEGTSTFFVSGSTIDGGTGGAGLSGICFPGPVPGGAGASGGAALFVDAAAQAWLVETRTTGGAGGAGGGGAPSCGMPAGPMGPSGADVVGSATLLPATKRVLTCATHVRELQTLTLTLYGQAGDLVWINSGLQTQWTLDVPFSGVRLVGNGSRRQFVGTMPAIGVQMVDVVFGDLGPGVEATTRHFQAFFRDVAGVSHHGSGAVVVVLDAAL